MNLNAQQLARLRNFLSLEWRTGRYGAPTGTASTSFMEEKGVKISSQKLSLLRTGKTPIDPTLASLIEGAYGVPSGWLSEDREFFYSLTPSQISAVRALVVTEARAELTSIRP